METNDTQHPSALRTRPLHPALDAGDAFYFTGEDKLRLVSLNSATGVTLTLVGRFLTLEGEIVPFSETQTPNTDRTAKTTDYTVGRGWLMNVAVFASAGTPLVGQCFAMLRVIRGATGATLELATLAQNFVTASQRLAWPGAPVQWTTQQRGFIRSITGTNPAAGAEISETVPTGAIWRLHAIRLPLTTDATVANRSTTIFIDDGTNKLAVAISTQSLTASVPWLTYFSANGVATSLIAGNAFISSPLADHQLLRAGYRIGTQTINLQAGDDYGAPQLLVEEWLEG